MTVLLTGATGFLGSKLLHSLVERGEQVAILVRAESSLERIASVRDRIAVYSLGEMPLERIFDSNRFDTIIHCATNYGRGQTDPLDILEANLILPLRLLQQACLSGVRCFVNTDTILDKQVSHYALAKGQFREWLETFQSSFVCINVALEHFYGAGDDPTKFVSFIVRQMLAGAERIELTAGEQKRDFIHIDDVVSAFMAILDGHAAGKNGYYDYQVGSGTTVPIRQFVETVRRIASAGRTFLDFGALPYREHEVMETAVDVSRLHALGWSPVIMLQDGLARMIAEEREMMKL
jgi:nucleoside-diphosphate-sugar epimerase